MLATPLLIALLIGIVSALVSGTIVHLIQLRKAAVFPAIPSRVETVDHRDAVVRYFGAAHDITNTITSAWNHARATKTDDTMLRELELPVLGEKIDTFREAASELSEQLTEHARAKLLLTSVSESLEKSWSYYRHDHYRTEVYFVPGPKGKMQMRTRQVYTHTSHDFTFHPEAAEVAQQELTSLLLSTNETDYYDAATRQLEISFSDDDRIRVWETVLEGRDEKPTDQEVFAALDAWNEAARAQHDIAVAIQNMRTLRRRATPPNYRMIRQSKLNYHFISYGGPGSTHEGPRGYQTTMALLDPSQTASRALSGLFSAMRTSDGHVAEIHRAWEEQGRFSDKDARDIAKSMLDHGIEMYEALFPKSTLNYDQRVKRGRTFAIAAATGLLAGLLSYVLLVI